MTLHTHYDNLKVSRTAPVEVIRASYKALAQKYHPDRNPGDDECERVMKLINLSYAVLSDPEQRTAHDAWISEQEQLTKSPLPAAAPMPPTSAPPAQPPVQAAAATAVAVPLSQPPVTRVVRHLLSYWLIYGGLGLWIWYANTDNSSTPAVAHPPERAVKTEPPKPPYVRPATAPNGAAWPRTSGYVGSYKVGVQGGLSSLTIDNSQNDADVFVKLANLGAGKPIPVRHMFISRGTKFQAKGVLPGSYDIRYQDLSSGNLSRSDPFELNEAPTGNGTKYSNMTMTLYKVRNGNMPTHRLDESEF